MEKASERRRMSYAATLDAAIRSASLMCCSKDPMARSAANRVLYDLQKLRAQMPSRRIDDNRYDER